MIKIKWKLDKYTDLLPDFLLSISSPREIIHLVIGPGGGISYARALASKTDTYLDLNYEIFAAFNNIQDWQIGVLRVMVDDDWPGELLWRGEGDGDFVRAEAELNYEPGEPLEVAERGKGREFKSTSPQLILARLGQGRFRSDLIYRWQGRCALTGIGVASILKASHIKPWAQCPDRERLDPANGLLLVAHVDALFDQHLITFDMDGRIIWQELIPQPDREALQLPDKLREPLNTKEKFYLEHHNQYFEELRKALRRI